MGRLLCLGAEGGGQAIMNDQDIQTIIDNSFKNFHTRGLDYICLRRTPEFTRKVYFFDGDASKLPEVVNPHDHRYHFMTKVVTGVMSNSHYLRHEAGEVYNEFEWNTPLNGGDGFTWKREARLLEKKRVAYVPGQGYFMRAEEFHTIRIHSDQAVIMLNQDEDVVPVGVPTITFMKDRQAPSLSGLYDRFTADEVIARLKTLETLGVVV
jgi:hypothetical protein